MIKAINFAEIGVPPRGHDETGI